MCAVQTILSISILRGLSNSISTATLACLTFTGRYVFRIQGLDQFRHQIMIRSVLAHAEEISDWAQGSGLAISCNVDVAKSGLYDTVRASANVVSDGDYC